jgi:uncharacterized phiE125 gp8 family phage protein
VKYSLNQSTAPTAEPVTRADAKSHLRIEHDAEAAREEVETYLNRQLMTATWDLYLDAFPIGRSPLLLPKNPVQSVTSITYTDTASGAQTFSSASYSSDVYSEPARIVLKSTAQWPEVLSVPNVVKVRFVAGYTSALRVPAKIKAAILLTLEILWMPEEAARLGVSLTNVLNSAGYGDEFSQYGQSEVGVYG